MKSEVSTALTFTLSHQEKSTQTRVADNDFEVKVIVKYKGIERVRIVHDTKWKTLVKQILNNNQASMRALSKYQDVKDDMLSVIKNQIKSEMCELLKKRNTILATENKNLLHFDTHKLSKSL